MRCPKWGSDTSYTIRMRVRAFPARLISLQHFRKSSFADNLHYGFHSHEKCKKTTKPTVRTSKAKKALVSREKTIALYHQTRRIQTQLSTFCSRNNVHQQSRIPFLHLYQPTTFSYLSSTPQHNALNPLHHPQPHIQHLPKVSGTFPICVRDVNRIQSLGRRWLGGWWWGGGEFSTLPDVDVGWGDSVDCTYPENPTNKYRNPYITLRNTISSVKLSYHLVASCKRRTKNDNGTCRQEPS